MMREGTMMGGLQLLAGVAVILLIVYDAFVTTVSAVSSGGPVTQRLGTATWRVLRRLAKRPGSTVLAAAGTTTVVLILAIWLVGLWAGWTLVFAADTGAVVHADTGEPADPAARVYFTGFVLYTLGIGDYVPSGATWQILTSVATLNGFALLTMTVSYLIPVVMAVNHRRRLGMLLHGLGPRSQDMLRLGFDGRSMTSLTPRLHDLAPEIAHLAQQYLSYPVLHFFHSPERKTAVEPGLVALDEALLILEHGVLAEARPDQATLSPLRAALERFEELVADEVVGPDASTPPPPDLTELVEAGVPMASTASFHAAVASREEHRRRLAGLLASALWRWEDAVTPAGPPSSGDSRSDRER
jgi:hypothetical protein